MTMPIAPTPAEAQSAGRAVWIAVPILVAVVAVAAVCGLCSLPFPGRYLPCGPDTFTGDIGGVQFAGEYLDPATATALTLADDGTFTVEGSPIGEGPVDGFGYPLRDGHGTWQLDPLAEDRRVELGYVPVEAFARGDRVDLTIARDDGRLVLWEYVGDPDSCEPAEFTTA